MNNSKRNVHNSGPLGQLVNSGSIFKVDDKDKDKPQETKVSTSPELDSKKAYFQTQAGVDFVEDELVYIDPSICEPWLFANRLEDDFGELEELINSIKVEGQLQPVLLRPHTNPHGKIKYEVIFGRRRHLACQSLGVEMIAIIKPNLSDQKALRYQHTENEYRQNVSDYSNAQLYQKLLDSKVFKSQRALAESLGISKSTVNDLLQFTKCDQEILNRIPNVHNVSRSLFLKLVKLSKKDEPTRLKLVTIAERIGSTINTENKLVSSLRSLTSNQAESSYRPKVVLDSDNKRLFTLRKDQRGNFNIVVNNNLLDEKDVDSLCSHLKSFFLKSDTLV